MSVADQIERLYSFMRIGDLPLILTIGIPTASVYGDWAQKSSLVLIALVLVSCLLVMLCARIAKELGRREAAERRLLDANAELERLSTTDALTSLGNRRHFDDVVAREAKSTARVNEQVSLILLDVDHFNSFNDRYGHPNGDEALRCVAAILRERARRPGDAAFRIGGEEFALLLGGTDAHGAARIMDGIRRDLQSLALCHEGSPTGSLTLSQGAAEIVGEDVCSAVEQADAALYRAKRDGRDRAYTQSILIAA